MKLIIIVVNDTDSEPLLKALLNQGYRVTRIASSGGFMRRGSSTLLMGVDADSVEQVMKMVREHCSPSVDPSIKKVTVFVLKVDKFVQL